MKILLCYSAYITHFFIFNNLLEKRTKESAATANNGISDEDEDQCQSVSRCFWLTILQSALVSKQTVWGKSIFPQSDLKNGNTIYSSDSMTFLDWEYW